jgi:hypothetical protein
LCAEIFSNTEISRQCFVSRTEAVLQKHFGNHALASLRLDRRKKSARDATIERPAHSRIRVGNLTQGTLTRAGQARRMFGRVRKQAQNAATHSHTQMSWPRLGRLWRFDGGGNNWLGDSTNTVRPVST